MRETKRATSEAPQSPQSAEVMTCASDGANALRQGSNKAVEQFKEEYGDLNADKIEFYPIGSDKFFIACHFSSDARLQKYYVMLWGVARTTKELHPIWVYKKHSVVSSAFGTMQDARNFVEKLITE